MNRKASLEWSLETTGKLIFYALILVGIIYMSMQLVGIFTKGETDWRAKQNLHYLIERIEYAQEHEGEATVILNLPENYLLFGIDASFPKNVPIEFPVQGFLDEYVISNLILDRPDCDACVCVYQIGSGLDRSGGKLVTPWSRVVACEDLDVDYISGNQELFSWRQKDAGSDYYPEVKVPLHSSGNRFLATTLKEPASVNISASETFIFIEG